MRDMKLSFLVFQLMCVALTLCQHIDVVDETLKLLIKGEDQMRVSPDPEVIIVVGNTGSGKSTLVHYLIDPSQIESVRKKASIDFTVIDHLDREEGKTSTTVSRTIVPEMIVDDHHRVWYDCPGFSDTRNSSIEIATTYFLKNILDHAKSVKIVFVVNYASVRSGYDRIDFDTLMKHATTLITDVHRYKPSVALIISKAPPAVLVGATIQDVTQELSANSAAAFIKEYRDSLEQKSEDQSAKIALADALLEEINGAQTRIATFFAPSDLGRFDKIPKLMQGRDFILNMVYDRVKYTPTLPNDFGYALTERAVLDIQAMILFVNNNITNTISKIDVELAKEIKIHSKRMNGMYAPRNFYDLVDREFKKLSENISELTPKKLLEREMDFLATIKVNIPNDAFKNLILQQQHMNVLTLISKDAVAMETEDWLGRLRLTTKAIQDGRNWHSFVVYLYEFMTSYQVQKDITAYNVKKVENWGKRNHDQGLIIDSSNWDAFLKLHVGFQQLLKDFEMNAKNFEVINDIIRVTVKMPYDVKCQGDTAVFTGEFLLLSNVNNTVCNHANNYHLLAFNKLFFDDDRTLRGDKMVVAFANEWEVTKKVELDIRAEDVSGKPGKNSDGTEARPEGEAGKPGSAGRNGATFIGYANTIKNGDWLTVDASGGKGGPGQDGSHAYPESPVFDIRETDTFDTLYGKQPIWDHSRYKYREIDGAQYGDSDYTVYLMMVCSVSPHHSPYILYARQCCKSDGLAGAGGMGGNAGFVDLFNTHGTKPKIVANQGPNGDHGKNVEPCKTMRKHVEYKVECQEYTKLQELAPKLFGPKLSGHFKLLKTELDPKCKRENEITSYNWYRRDNATAVRRPDSSMPFVPYKMQMLKHFSEKFRYDELWAMYNALEQSLDVRKRYRDTDFILEMNDLESNFYQWHAKVDFLPFYESLIERIDDFGKNKGYWQWLWQPDDKILVSVYTAALSKADSLRKGRFSNMVIDVDSYIDMIIGHIKTLDETGRQKVVNEYRDQYFHEIQGKIDEANKLLHEDVIPDVENNFHMIDQGMDDVFKETTDKETTALNKVHEQEKALQKLRENFVLRSLLSSLDLTAKLIGTAGPEGKALGGLINIGTNVGGRFIIDPSDKMNEKVEVPKGVSTTLKEIGKMIEEHKKKKIEAFDKEIKKIEEELKDEKEEKDKDKEHARFVRLRALNDLEGLKKKLADAKAKERPSQREIKQLKKDIKTFAKGEKKLIEDDKKSEEDRKKTWTERFEKLDTAIELIDSGVDVYNKIVEDYKKITKMEEAIAGSRNSLKALQDFENVIYDKLMPDMKSLHDTVDEQINSLEGESHVSLDVKKWRIQSTIKDAKEKLLKAISGYDSATSVQSLFDKVTEGMNMIINIYDRIQNYEEHFRFAGYLTALQTAKYREVNMYTDERWALINGMQINIQSNIVLGQYLTAMNAFKQAVFPFASTYLDVYRLPQWVKNDKKSLEEMVDVAATQLTSLRDRIRELNETTINRDDWHIVSAEFNSDYSATKPFYVWNSKQYHKDILDLLHGRPSYFYADVSKANEWDAVKFNTAHLRFKAADSKFQQHLDQIMNTAYVTMRHHGTSYYRCGNQFYTIDSPPIEIGYSIQKNGDKPIKRSGSYDKLRGGTNLLSPYAMWTIQLSDVDVHQLDEIIHQTQIDMELNGRGQYVSSDATICSTDLTEYYKVDLSISELNDIEPDSIKEIEHSSTKKGRDAMYMHLEQVVY